eukprot:TRINITY_DN1633_c0_g5_i1.p1 TRINITY_DN1633_c0_g5~~TRINITY_DN1633_c0_g5_i1.p1  ORF type:complete len:597 (+),score=145.12 TRINITY_DN1633_c0_g5_i1:51-1841(+)
MRRMKFKRFKEMNGFDAKSLSAPIAIIEEHVIKPNGEMTIKKYTKGRLLGKGGFAKCYEVTNAETNKISAAKIIAKASLTKNRAKQKLMTEIKIHRSLHHENIVAFEQFFEDAENVYIILELCSNQTLSELIKKRKRLTELETKCYITQLIEGLKYLHAHRVIHRDLKLGNVFLTDRMVLKIGDFGLAAKLEFDGERKRTICGTPNYIAPEILEGTQGHSYEVDTWSLGVILYTLLIGKPPFETRDVKTTYNRIRKNIYNFPTHIAISDEARDIVQSILSSDPSRRPKYKEILAHPFFSATNIPAVLPMSTLVCPPSGSFVQQFTGREEVGLRRLGSTGPCKENLGRRERFAAPNTERGVLSRRQSKPTSSHLVTSRATVGSGPTKDKMLSLKGPEVWVKKWVDYSSKYGLGYFLSSDSIGVFFNDSTKIILDPNGANFEYIERGANKTDTVAEHTLADYPKCLQKKVTLLNHFRSYLNPDYKKPDAAKRAVEKAVYVKKWLKTRHAIMFRLSNKIVQVVFQDATEIILSSESRILTYVNKRGERLDYHLNNALDSENSEMTKRLKYTKEILAKLLKQNQPANHEPPPIPSKTNNI